MEYLKKLSYLFIVLAIIGACTSPKEKLQSNIKLLEDSLFSDQSKMIDKTIAKDLVDAYVLYTNEIPEDEKAGEYLFKAGDLALNLNMPKKAIELFDRVMNEYPDYEKVPQCLFLKGYVFENDLKDLVVAKKIYEEFLEKYPDDEFADDAEVSIRNLGKSPEELIKEFEERAKQQEQEKENV